MIRPDYQRTELLFNKYDLRASLDNTKAKALAQAETKFVPKDAAEEDIVKIADSVAAGYSINIPKLDEDSITTSSEERQIDVSQDFNRTITDRSRPFYRAFTAIVFHVPFTGDKQLFFMRANTYTYNPPRAEIMDGELRITILIEGEDVTPEQIKSAFQHELEEIKKGLGWIAQDVGPTFSSSLLGDVLGALRSKQQKEKTTEDLLGKLGFKMELPAAHSRPIKLEAKLEPTVKQKTPVGGSGFKHDFFISYASEDRDVARQLFDALIGRGYKVWFDQTELHLGDSLTDKIRDGLASSQYGVVLLSPNYFAVDKKWTGHELRTLSRRQIQLGPGVILPVWKDVDTTFLEKEFPDLVDIKGVNFKDGLDVVINMIEAVYNS